MRNRKWSLGIGIGNVDDDFNDHQREVGVLCEGRENSSGTDLVTMWQSILAADGYLTADQIDGYFGPDTAAATAGWKEYVGLEPTGEVDQSVWATADDNLKVVSEGDYTGIEYVSPEDGGTVSFARVVGGKGNYKLLNVDLEGTELENTNQASIELFDATIALEKA